MIDNDNKINDYVAIRRSPRERGKANASGSDCN